MVDTIKQVDVRLIQVPLDKPVSDAKVSQGKQTPLKEIMITTVSITTDEGREGFGYTYCKRHGGFSQYALAKEYAPLLIEEDPNDISRLWNKLLWSSISIGRSGIAVQSITPFDIALWDLKAKRANLSITKLLGQYKEEVPCYNTTGGFLQDPIEKVIENAQNVLEEGAGGIKIKVGQKDFMEDIRRVEELRKALGDDVAIMADANQQWNLSTALKVGRHLDNYDLVWLEEPVNAHDIEGHYQLSRNLETPIATGEMLTSLEEGVPYIERRAFDICQLDAPRIGGITQFKKIMDRAEEKQLVLAPHYSMEIHLPLVACYNGKVWVEHFEWFEQIGLFQEKVKMNKGMMEVPTKPGIGLSLNLEVADSLTIAKEMYNEKNM